MLGRVNGEKTLLRIQNLKALPRVLPEGWPIFPRNVSTKLRDASDKRPASLRIDWRICSNEAASEGSTGQDHPRLFRIIALRAEGICSAGDAIRRWIGKEVTKAELGIGRQTRPPTEMPAIVHL